MTQTFGDPVYDHMRRSDLEAFRDAARRYRVHILVRRTNSAALQYIGRQGYIPKPIDCKPKTADQDVLLPSGLIARCGGLVVNPALPGFDKAFKSSAKLQKAKEAWSEFAHCFGIGAAISSGAVYLKGYTQERVGESHVFTLNRGGIYLMNPFPNHPHYGCLMFCPFQIEQPFPAGDPQALTPLVMRKTNCFLHGDYDLYGIVSAEAPERRTVVSSIQYGVKNLSGERFAEIREFLNRSIGAPMIQHGPQESIEHADDHLDVFWVNGDLTEVRGRAAIEKLYLTEFHGRTTGPQTAPQLSRR